MWRNRKEREEGGRRVGVLWQVFLKTLKVDDEKRLSHFLTRFPSLPSFPLAPLCQWVCPHLPGHSSFSLSPCLRLRCWARVTPQHCSVISGPRAASYEPIGRSAQSKKWPSTGCLYATQSPPSLLSVMLSVLVTNHGLYPSIPAGVDLPGVALTVYHKWDETVCDQETGTSLISIGFDKCGSLMIQNITWERDLDFWE